MSPERTTMVSEAETPPRVWALMCYRAGDNNQILALAEALKWPYEIKRLTYRKYEFLSSVFRCTGLNGIVRNRSSPLEPPWPDLIISSTFRNEPVCRWIQQQAVGKTVRYVHIGRPWARMANFDLVVSVLEYRQADHPHILQNNLSLQLITAERLAQAAVEWQSRLAHLPRPYIAVLIGGYSGPYTFDHAGAERLGYQASEMAKAMGGSLLITTSLRTPHAPIDTLIATVDVPFYLFRWTPDAVANPFLAYLALADAFIVTCDSAAMLTEACATRKPVYLFDLGLGARVIPPLAATAKGYPLRYRWWQRWNLSHVKAFLYRQLMRIPPRRMTRDIRLVHQFLIASGRAVWLGQRFPTDLPPPLPDDMPRAVERVRALFAPAPPRAPTTRTDGGVQGLANGGHE